MLYNRCTAYLYFICLVFAAVDSKRQRTSGNDFHGMHPVVYLTIRYVKGQFT
jgi:hypothetical protein